MNGIYSYVTETNHVPAVYNVRAVLWFGFTANEMQFPMTNILYLYINSFQITYSVPNVVVFLVP